MYRFVKKIYCARILIEGARFPPFGFDTAEISYNSNEGIWFGVEIVWFGVEIMWFGVEVVWLGIKIVWFGLKLVWFGQKHLLCPDSDRGRSVSPLRVRYSGDKL